MAHLTWNWRICTVARCSLPVYTEGAQISDANRSPEPVLFMNSPSIIIFCIFLALAPIRWSCGQEWTRFRGPNGTGLGKAENLPATWKDNDYAWRVELPGFGHSSPVLWGNKLFVTAFNSTNAELVLVCLDASTGKPLWQKPFSVSHYKLHANNNYAASTPATDDQ